ncbi:MAG TPA: DUF1566 domain-containing protein [bacterium]|nr:DUF1566 domain-containing protein [bacterium]HPS30705.1 DUF1566 domain-containing protein [bacterium]
MRKIFMTASAVLFAVCCSNGSIVKSGSGESCNRTADCSDGLKCINFICTDLSEADNDSNSIQFDEDYDNDNPVTASDEDENTVFDPCGETFCYVDSKCVKDGTTDSTHLCQKCDVTENKYSWVIKPAGILCRESKYDCDVAEICDGIDSSCPEDYIAGTDVPCTDDGNSCNGDEYCDGKGKCLLHINPVKCKESEYCEEETGRCLCESGSTQKIACLTDISKFQKQICDEKRNWQDEGVCYCEKGAVQAVTCPADSTKFQRQICNESGNWQDDGSCFNPLYPVFCTGQTHCYGNEEEILCPSSGEDFYGQDSQYMNLGYCIPKRFSITYSGLIPEKIIVDLNTGFQWQGTLPEIYEECEKDTLCEFGDALDYCESLVYGGYEDWRLPKDDEMMTVINYGKTGPAYDEMYFPASHTYFFWSYADDGEGFSRAIMAAVYGSFDREYYETRGTVMCIRNAQLPKHIFSEETVNDVTVVTDSVTGLQWTKGVFSNKTWQEALSSCENLEYAGYTDWRLPDINELAGLVDRGKSLRATDFPGLSIKDLISSTSYLSDTAYAWGVELMYGRIDGRFKDSGSYDVICVR